MQYVYRQEMTENGAPSGAGIWTSEPFDAADERAVRQGVIAGCLGGVARWAEGTDGALIYGLDRRGKEMTAADRDQIVAKVGTMNLEAFDRFSAAYRAGLLSAVTEAPDAYAWPASEASRVADKMLDRIRHTPRAVNYGGGGGFKRACRTLGIKYTRKAIFEYLGVTQ